MKCKSTFDRKAIKSTLCPDGGFMPCVRITLRSGS